MNRRQFIGTTLAAAVLALAKDPEGAKIKAAKARDFVRQRQRETMGMLRRELSGQ